MLRSMTGFGRYLTEDALCGQQWEIKSVNSRYLDLKWHLPPLARYLEPALEKVARRHARRGRVEISLRLDFTPGNAPRPVFDASRAQAMLDDLDKLAKRRNETFQPDYSFLLNLPALWTEPEIDQDSDLGARLEGGLALAFVDWNESRAAEGAALAADLRARILRMEEWTEIMGESAPRIRDERARVLKERLSSFMAASSAGLDEQRFLQEVVILTDKLDVSEELTRLAAHLERLGWLLEQDGDVGRRLDFTLQECFREINTLGNKLADAQLSGLVVDFKNELEKCREQAQNVE